MTFLFRFIKQLFSKLFKLINWVRLLIMNTIFIAIVITIFVLMNDQGEAVTVADNSYLRLNLNGSIVEQKQAVNLSQQISKQLSDNAPDFSQEFTLAEVINTINFAQKDTKIKGLILELSGLQSASLNQISDIGNAINEFKSSGKPVYAYADNYSQTQYKLASYADHITLAPNGLVLLQGFSVNRLYYKDLIDNLLITPHIFKVGTYKSFVEPYLRTDMSSYSKEASGHWLNQLWQGYIADVVKQRNNVPQLNAQSINPTLKQFKNALIKNAGDSAQYALAVGLVDELTYYQPFTNKLLKADESKVIDYQKYASTLPPLYASSDTNNKIAIIYASGEIASGYSDGSTIADKSFNKLLKQALNNDQIKAVVIRIDSPGGSAAASENIRQQVLALKNTGKKVVVSMGSVAASGGYWIASAADQIIAAPTTLTGSIGIFGMFATVDKSLNKIGIHQDGVSTNELSNISVTQPLSPELAEIFQIGIEHGYANFLKVVSEGRDLTEKEVDKIAQGRVWTGVDALQNGLVDKLGNLQTAIDSAAEIAELNDYDVLLIEPQVSSKQAFINELFSKSVGLLPTGLIKTSSMLNLLGDIDKEINFMTRLNDPQNRFIYCTECTIR
ncbi:signal peptide peptidase SppA [Psychromonas sp. RZ22]|uniref:signal peptide peptidase SppA n=1 Tax=Psychromonas algarum TaxID=2555643 RepID=UPI00106734AF|nr:signal peptide peptidase SppA [Psychromonas sp. RZ22]TEW55193.1 signal peptide peptidase SppA [Psychromonas sp. RZ22]